MEDNPEDRRKFFIAAMNGDIGFFEEARNKEMENCDEGYFLRQTSYDNYNILHIAIQYGQNELIRKVLLERLLPSDAITNKLIYQQDYYKNTPLHAAEEEGNIEFLKLLLKYEEGEQEVTVLRPAPVSSRLQNNDGNTPLHVALIKGRNLDVAEMLVKHFPDLVRVTNKEGNTPLHVAAALGDADIFKMLLDEIEHSQETIKLQNCQGNTALHVASIHGNVAIARLLLEKNPKLARVTNHSNETPLHLAIIKHQIIGKKSEEDKEDLEGFHMLSEMELNLQNAAEMGDVRFVEEARNKEIEHGNYFLRQNLPKEENLLHIAIQSKQYKFIYEVTKRLLPRSIINKLMSKRNFDGNTPLHVAAMVGNAPIFELLLEFENGQYEIKNANDFTPFHVALISHNLEVARLLVRRHFDLVYSIIDTYTSLIELLVEKDSSVACWHDIEGYTPLHRAAFLPTSFGLPVIKIILKGCPESAKKLDNNNADTILHLMINRIFSYKKGIELLQIPEIQGIKTVVNKQGKTPLNLALKLNFNMVRLLIKNHSLQPIAEADEGRSTYDLEQLLSHFERDKRINEKKTTEEYGVVDGVKFQFLQEKLTIYGMNFLSSRDSKGRNVLHNLMQLQRGSPIIPDEYLNFVKQVVDSYPTLVYQLDYKSNTPLHILLQNSHDIKILRCTSTSRSPHDHHYDYNTLRTSTFPFELLKLCCKYAKIVSRGDHRDFIYDPPWLVQNVEGNTPLHEALKANHILPLFSEDIMADFDIITRMSNKCKETPLHLLAGNPMEEWSKEVIRAITESNEEAATWQDKDGLTPIMRAVQVGHINTVEILDSLNQQGSRKADNNGQTIWHMLVNQPSSMTREFVQYIETKPDLTNLLKEVDKKGKTPLHLALESRRFTHAHLFLKCSLHGDELLSAERLESIRDLLNIKDGDGVTPGDILASIADLPQHLEKLLSKYPDKLQGYRSGYGISTKEMNNYVNTMGVIAALLATISFTAAFTVPGGVIQDDKNKNVIGSPLLVDVVAFQAFMFFDISTMCLSTMVLFCLLWILAADTKRNSVMLMDFSISLLLISFYTTLLTFMAGVYVITIHVKPWITIYTLVICTTLLSLMHKCIVIEYLGPIGSTLSTSGSKVFRYITNLVRRKNENEQSGDESPTHPPSELSTTAERSG